MHQVYVMGHADEARWVAVDGDLLIGRSKDCDLHIEDPRMSRRHARLFLQGDRLWLEDLKSPNGTFVNGRRLQGTVTLTDGDLIALGKSQIRVGSDALATREHREGPAPELVKPVELALPPDLEDQVAQSYFDALGIGDQTLLESKADALEQVVRQTRNFAVLHEVSKRLQREHEMNPMLGAVMDLLLTVTGAERGYVVLFDADDQPRVEIARSRTAEPTTGRGPTLSQTVLRHVVDERSGVICGDPTADERFVDSSSLFLSDTRSLMAAPILLQNRVLGLFEVESSYLAARFTERDLDLLSIAASMVGVALENLRLAEQREETIRALERAQAELLATQDRLIRSEQMAAIGRLATGIAHEVKNHLSPFMLAEMIAKKYPDDRQIQDASEMMLEAQQHILDLVREIRTFVSGSPTQLVREPTDVAAVVEGVVRFMSCDAVVKRTSVELRIEERPVLEIDPKGIRQVLVNLIKNAADAVDAATGKIEVGVTERAGRVIIAVRDNGPGIPEEAQERLFEPFYTTKGDRGLGLGLDISRKLVEAHGGTLTFDTNPGHGTSFRINLPSPEEVANR